MSIRPECAVRHVPTLGRTVARLGARRYRQGVAVQVLPTRELSDLAARCGAVLGPELTAYVAGADSVERLADLIDDPMAAEAVEERLHTALFVVDVFAEANLLGVVRDWLRDVGAAGVPGRSPASLLRESPREGGKRVVAYAEQFVAT
jgi:hypothetical protein